MSCLKAISEIKIQLSAIEFLDAGPDNVPLLIRNGKDTLCTIPLFNLVSI